MNVKITKTMVTALNKELKARKKNGVYTSIYTFDYDDTLTPKMYETFVNDDLFKALDNGDFDASKSAFKTIRVIYNDDCYAVNRYITTDDLIKCFNHSDKTYDGFLEAVFDNFEI